MPGIYAHYRLGCDVLGLMKEEDRKKAERRRALYDVGLHGPDLLFYYKPMLMTLPGRTGYGTHKMNGIDFFEGCAGRIETSDKGEAAQAYMYGLLCHFALDSLCHPYVEERTEAGVPHTATEASFDRFLLVSDGRVPHKARLCGHISVSLEDAETIALFYPRIKPAQIVHAAKSMVFYNGLIRAPNKIKKALIYGVLKISGSFDEAYGMVITEKPQERCRESDVRLSELYGQAIERSLLLIDEMKSRLTEGTPLGESFDHTFGAD